MSRRRGRSSNPPSSRVGGRGITDNETIADALRSNYQTVTNSVYHIHDKLEMCARKQRIVYPVVPDDKRPDELLFED